MHIDPGNLELVSGASLCHARGCLLASRGCAAGSTSSWESWTLDKGLSWQFSMFESSWITVFSWGTHCNPWSICASNDEIIWGSCSNTNDVFLIVEVLAKRLFGSFCSWAWEGEDWSMRWRRLEVDWTDWVIWSATMVLADPSLPLPPAPDDVAAAISITDRKSVV